MEGNIFSNGYKRSFYCRFIVPSSFALMVWSVRSIKKHIRKHILNKTVLLYISIFFLSLRLYITTITIGIFLLQPKHIGINCKMFNIYLHFETIIVNMHLILRLKINYTSRRWNQMRGRMQFTLQRNLENNLRKAAREAKENETFACDFSSLRENTFLIQIFLNWKRCMVAIT